MTFQTVDGNDDSADVRLLFPDAVSDPAGLLYGLQKTYGKKARKQSHAAYKTLLHAHAILASVIGRAMRRTNGAIYEITNVNEERTALFACYVIGMTTCEEAIEEARYLQAFALLRQEMEIVGQLKDVRAGKRRKSTPDLNGFDKSIKRLYDDLSSAAHASKHYMLQNFTTTEAEHGTLGPIAGTRYFPICDREIARKAFGLHLIFTLEFITELSIDHSDRHGCEFTKDDINALTLANQILINEGILEDGVEIEVYE